MNNTIVLCGFMGCGKTTIGKLVAEKLGYHFIDMDEFITSKQGKTVNQIFDDYGEDYFRKLELNAATELSNLSNTVIATGGGAVMNIKVVETFHKENIKIIFIDTPFYVIMQRIKNDNTRPLLLKSNSDSFKRLYEYRYNYYVNRSDIVISSSENQPCDLANIIVDKVWGDRFTK